jgi:2-methylcitrate dehydratase PrpD
LPVDEISLLEVRSPAAAVQPLIHHRPETGLQAKFSLEYAVAATLLAPYPGVDAFTDLAVQRPAVRRLIEMVRVTTTAGGDGLLTGETRVTATLADGTSTTSHVEVPPGAPSQPPTSEEFGAKLLACRPDLVDQLTALSWDQAAEMLGKEFPGGYSNAPERHVLALPSGNRTWGTR